MTDYFDVAARTIRAIDKTLGDEAYLFAVAEVEKDVVRDVILCTGDREFPDALREKIMTTIACKGVYVLSGLPPTEDARAQALAMRYSELIEDLHSAFHALASRRYKVRWGFWSDSPRQNLVSRKCHDEEQREEPTSSEREDWAAEEKHDFIKEGR
jgi:hypothetical protein